MSARSDRLTAALTGKGRELGPEEAHAKNVLAITGRIHKAQARLRQALVEVKRLRKQVRHDKRELRAVLQRDSSVRIEGDNRLELAGAADGADRAVALSEERK